MTWTEIAARAARTVPALLSPRRVADADFPVDTPGPPEPPMSLSRTEADSKEHRGPLHSGAGVGFAASGDQPSNSPSSNGDKLPVSTEAAEGVGAGTATSQTINLDSDATRTLNSGGAANSTGTTATGVGRVGGHVTAQSTRTAVASRAQAASASAAVPPPAPPPSSALGYCCYRTAGWFRYWCCSAACLVAHWSPVPKLPPPGRCLPVVDSLPSEVFRRWHLPWQA